MIEIIRKAWTIAGLSLIAVSALAQPRSVPAGPKLDASALEGYHKQYHGAAAQKAFAVSRNGKAYSAVFGHPETFEAVRAVSVGCLAEFKTLCQIWLVNDENVWAQYERSRSASSAALRNLGKWKAPAEPSPTNTEVVPDELRDGGKMHSATPGAAPRGGQLIDTQGVLALLRQQRKPVLIDTLHGKSIARNTLPSAAWIQGAGWEDPSLNAHIERHFRLAMKELAPSKDTPIVVFCSNIDCWLSWNATLRLVKQGYRKVYWYRGGIAAWQAAGLPLVSTPLTAHLW